MAITINGNGSITGISAGGLPDGTVDTDMLSDDAVSTAKMAGLARGKIIIGDASGNPVALTVGSSGQALKSDGTDISWGAIATGGLTEADNWRITSPFSGGVDPISSNLERVDGTLQPSTQLGSGMSVSSGVWTFPSTGYWHVSFYHTFHRGGSTRWIESFISATADDGSNWDHRIGFAQTHIHYTDNEQTFESQVASTLLDITDTSNHKIRFGTDAGSSVTTYGHTGDNQSHMIFMKLGDT